MSSREDGERWVEWGLLTATKLLSVCCVCSFTQSCLTLCHPMDCSPPGSSVHGIFQARILEWVAVSSSRGSSRPRDASCISLISCIASRSFIADSPGKPSTSCILFNAYKMGVKRKGKFGWHGWIQKKQMYPIQKPMHFSLYLSTSLNLMHYLCIYVQ